MLGKLRLLVVGRILTRRVGTAHNFFGTRDRERQALKTQAWIFL